MASAPGALEVIPADSTERAYRYLEEQIVEVKIPPGERIGEAEVARALHMSRGPVREALRKLESHGLVVRQANRGVRVADFDEREIEELDILRSHLLALAGRLAAQHAEPGQIRDMHAIVDQMKSVVDAEDYSAYADLNIRFHGLLSEMTGNTKLTHHLSLVYRQIRRYHLLAMALREGMLDSYESHQKILEAIEAGDARTTEDELSNHGSYSYQVLRENFSRLQKAFGGKASAAFRSEKDGNI